MNFKSLFNFFLFSKHSVVVLLLVFTQLVLTSFSQVLTNKNAYNDLDKFQFALMALLISLIFGGLIKVYCFFIFSNHLKIKTEENISSYAASKFTDWAIVEVRVQIRVLLRLFLLIIPGIVEAVRLSLSIPYVFLDERMKDLTFDPIEESRDKITLKGPYFAPLFLVTIALPIVIALSTHTDKTVFESTQSLIFGVLGAATHTISIVVYYSYIVNIFILQKNKEE